jgi:asparagine synthase (glutamine-hydrolysing)
MCGINMALNYPDKLAETIVTKMMQATHHRGSDSVQWLRIVQGSYVAGNRLKISGLSDRSNQPLVTDDGNGVLVWNGAIYNFEELKNELLTKGVKFASRSDSEVLLYWLYIFGSEGLSRLSGMFSIIFINKQTKKVLVARDPLGQKPLYYYRDENQWLFSSEFRGILASGVVRKIWDDSQYTPYFYFRHSSPTQTFLVDVRQVMPGEIISLDFQGVLVERKTLTVSSRSIEIPNAAFFEELVVDSVLKHFHAEVPVGVILSGGADSGLLYKTWHSETGVPLRSYTAVFEQKYQNKYQDFRYAQSLARKCNGRHQEALITPEGFLKLWPDYIQALDHPVGDTAGFLTWIISRKAATDVKILIGGAGADELFGGYNRHKAFLLCLQYPRLARYLKRFFCPVPILPRMFQKAVVGISKSEMETYLNYAALQPVPPECQTDLGKWFEPKREPFKAALNWDRSIYLVHDILKVFDNATMAHGIEGRSPYLDFPIVSLSMSLTEEQHRSLKPKQWIKELLLKYGSEDIARRKKLGFGLPIKEWLQDNLNFRKEVFSKIKQFESDFGRDFPAEMRNLAQKPETFVDHSFLQIYNLYLLACWRYTHKL